MKIKDWLIPIVVVLIGTFGIYVWTVVLPTVTCGGKPWCKADLIIQVKPWDINQQEFQSQVGEFTIEQYSECRDFGPFALENADYSEMRIHLINSNTNATILEFVPREQVYEVTKEGVVYTFHRPEGGKPHITLQCVQ